MVARPGGTRGTRLDSIAGGEVVSLIRARPRRGPGRRYPWRVHDRRGPTAYHLAPAAAWASTPEDEPFRPASLATEGFVHLTHWMTDLLDVANALYRSEDGAHVVITVDLGSLTVPWRYDGDDRYPHAYGPLDRIAIVEVRPIERDSDGRFLPIPSGDWSAAVDAWACTAAEPGDDDFEAMVYDALDALPETFRSRLGTVAVVIEEEATPEQLAIGRAAGLYGLYQGVPRTAWGADQAAIPSKITIFRRPHLQRYGTGPALAAGVAATVRHEVAHHFGISDERLHELEREGAHGSPPR